jgi:uncharacterized LabA/DUF88 family protein
MSFRPRYTILIDGAFVIRKLESRLKRFPTAQDIQSIAKVIAESECVSDLARLRVYFYHARPTADVLVNPISKEQITLGTTLPDFALRLGETDTTGWRVGDTAFRHIMRKPRLLRASDLVPVITQKGVDLRIGLDMARLALTRSVEAIVAVTGDSDLIPAFKFVRREGVRVFLCHMGHRIKRDLAAHADRTVKFDPPSPEAIYRHVDEAA